MHLQSTLMDLIFQHVTHVDMIMDMLGNPKLRQIITEGYQSSNEPMRVREAITEVRYDLIL